MSRLLPDVASSKIKPPAELRAGWLALSANAVSWIAQNSRELHQCQTQPWDRSLSALQHLLTHDLRFAHPSMVLCPSLAKHWLQAPSVGVSSLHELHAVAAARAQQLFGTAAKLADTPASDWHVSGEWHATQAFLCTAWSAGLSSFKYKLHTPLSIALTTYRSSLPPDGWCAITLAGELHLIQTKHRRIINLRSTRLPTALSGKALEGRLVQEWHRDLLRTGTQAKNMHWLHLMPNELSESRNPCLIPIASRQSLKPKPSIGISSSGCDYDESSIAAWAVWDMRGAKL